MKATNETTVISIYAEDKKGLLGQILQIFNRSNYPVHQLNASRTDVKDIVLITIEVGLPVDLRNVIVCRIEKIIEVFQAKSYSGFDAEQLQVGHYLVAKDFPDGAFFALLQKNGANIAGMTADGFVIQKTGTATDLEVFYRALDGPALLSYCKSGLIVADSMVPIEDLYLDNRFNNQKNEVAQHHL